MVSALIRGAPGRGGSVEGDEVRLGQQFLQRHIGDAEFAPPPPDGVVDAVSDDVHADGLGHDAQMLADAAEADDAQGLALQLDALAVGLLLPLALTHGVAGDGDIAGAGEHMAHGQLRHGRGRRHGGCCCTAMPFSSAYLTSMLSTPTPPRMMSFSLPPLASSMWLAADLGLGADHHGVKVPQGGAQLIGLIELLHHLVAQSHAAAP